MYISQVFQSYTLPWALPRDHAVLWCGKTPMRAGFEPEQLDLNIRLRVLKIAETLRGKEGSGRKVSRADCARAKENKRQLRSWSGRIHECARCRHFILPQKRSLAHVAHGSTRKRKRQYECAFENWKRSVGSSETRNIEINFTIRNLGISIFESLVSTILHYRKLVWYVWR